MEIWKPVVNYEGCYEVSNAGNVRSVRRKNCYGRMCGGINLQTQINSRTGYVQVGLCKNGTRKLFAVHRLVAAAFIPAVQGANTVNHKNENKTDNRVENLEWISLPDNLRYGTHTARATANKPEMSGAAHFNFGKRGIESVTHKGEVVGIKKDNPSVIIRFDTAADAARELNISSGQLCDAINGKAKSCGGYYWSRENG